ERLCAHYRISGVPVTDTQGRLVGIVTNRDMRFEDDRSRLARDVMTTENLVTAPVGVTRERAFELLRRHKVEKLPLVDAEDRLRGLITVKDFITSEQIVTATTYEVGRYVVCGALGSVLD